MRLPPEGLLFSDPRVEDLRPVFDEWLRVYGRASDVFPQASSFWYLEPTMVTLLAAAAWRSDIPCVTEVRVLRDAAKDGHADLVLQCGGRITAVEAKIHYFDNLGAFEKVLGQLDNACSEAATLRRDWRRLGLSFGVLERGELSPEELMSEALRKAEPQGVHLAAWSLALHAPEEVRPGCLALGRVV